MGIKPRKGGLDGGWYWSLPDDFMPKMEWISAVGEGEDALEDAQGAQLSKQGILGTFGASSDGNEQLADQCAVGNAPLAARSKEMF